MKLYSFALTLLLPFFVGAQTIPYQLDFLDVNPDDPGTRILELAGVGSRIYWATEGNVNYLSNGSARSTFSFQGGLGLRDGIVPLGNIGDLYYFHYASGAKRYNFVINAIVPVPEILEFPLLENEKFVHTEPVLVAGKLYSVRQQKVAADGYKIAVELIASDPGTQESTIIVSDTVYQSIYPTTTNVVTDGSLVFFARSQPYEAGPATYDPATGTVTNIGRRSSDRSLTFERVGDRTLMRYQSDSLHNSNEHIEFVTPSAIEPLVAADLREGNSAALPFALIGTDSLGQLLSVNYSTGEATVLGSTGVADKDAQPQLFQLDQNEVLFYRRTTNGNWKISLTDGTVGGTRDAATIPNLSTRGPAQTVRLGNYVALISNNHPLYLFDPRNDDLQEVAADFDLVGPNPPLAALGDRLYFAARLDGRGEQLHYLTIDDQRTLNGTAFTDANENGIQDTDEPGIANLLVTVEGPEDKQFLTTDDEGNYALAVLDGATYTVTAHQPDCYARTTAADSYTITVPTDEYEDIDFGYALQNGAADLTLYFNAGRVRCNTEAPFWITVRNDGCLPLAGTATVKLQDNVSFVSVSRDSVTLTDNTITFTFDTLQPGEVYHNALKLKLPNEDFAGDTILLGGAAGAKYKNEAAVTDSVEFATVLRCAVDPNDKAVFPFRPDSTHSNYTQADETLRYTIRFENMGNDTAFAVRIEDQLSEHLDYTSLLPIEGSHAYDFTLADDGLLTIDFPGIVLVDTSVSATASQGFVIFEIKPQEGLPDFTRIENTAGIFFDFNRPVITNTVVSTIVGDLDKDDDGVYFWEDCDDNDAAISPQAKEIAGNEVDENCDGIIEKTTATTTTVLSGALQVYPNPAGRWLQLRYSQSTRLRASLVDATGRQLLSTSFTGELQLAVDRYPAGVYLLRIEDPATGQAGQHRIVLRGR